jgi:polar amino acid transport system permease protein
VIDLIQTYWLYFLIGQYPQGPLGGVVLTVLLAALALLLAMPIGLLLGLARVSPVAALRRPVTVLVYLVRGIPLLLMVFWVYFYLPTVTGHKTDQFTTMLIALVVFDGVYLAEIVRAGIQGVPRGQTDAARALGFGYVDTMKLIVMPQAVRPMLPSLINQFVATIKETSLGYIIGLTEVSFIAAQINTQVFTRAPEVCGVLAFTYFVLCFGLSQGAYALERRLARPVRREPPQGESTVESPTWARARFRLTGRRTWRARLGFGRKRANELQCSNEQSATQ